MGGKASVSLPMHHNDNEMMGLKRLALMVLASLGLSENKEEFAPSTDIKENMEDQSVDQKGLLSLPNEIIDMILDDIQDTETLFAIGRTCHQLRRHINDESEKLSTRIIKREHARLTKSFPSPFADVYGPRLEGLTILEALRKCTLYFGRHQYYWAAATIHLLAIWYEHDHGIFDGEAATGQCEKSFLEEMLEYLLHLDAAAHPYHKKCDGWEALHECKNMESVYCNCDTCFSVICRGATGAHCYIDVAVWKFELSGWDMDHAIRFFRERSIGPGKMRVGENEWLDMVRHVLKEPIQQYTKAESSSGHAVLSKAVWVSSGRENPWFSSSLDKFIETIGLPGLKESSEKWNCVYFPRLETSKRREINASSRKDYAKLGARGMEQLWKSTRAVRAAKECCVRSHDEYPEVQLLDPENLLLRAAVFEELLVTARLG